MNLEDDLRHALRRHSPDPGLAGRVLARIEAEDRQPSFGRTRRPAVQRWRAAAASVVLVTLLGGYTTYRVVEHRRGERAREELLQAMRIASEKVSYAQHEARSVGSND